MLADQIKEYAEANPQDAYQRVGYTGQLKKQGDNLVGLCPFHEDSEPSFKITLAGEKAGLFYCFGCGAAGSVIDFVKQSENLVTDREAIERSAELLGITGAAPPPRKRPAPQKAPTPSKSLSVKIAEKCHDVLLAPKNEKHLLRFLDARALSREIIEAAQIGFDGDRYTIPVYDQTGELLDIRKYKLASKQYKMLPWEAKDEKKGIPGTGSVKIFGWQHVKDEQTVVLAEGELDALALVDRSIPAFAVTNGAGNWPGEPPDLSGKTIYLCGDADNAGRKMNETLPSKLYAAGAAQVYIVEWLPGAAPGYDVTDYFQGGGTADGFRKLMGKARPISPPRRTTWTADDLLAADFPSLKYAVPGFIPEGLTILCGRPKVGKSWLGLQIALAVAAGGKCLGKDVEQGKVLLICLEDSARRVKDRMAKQGWPRGTKAKIETEWSLLKDGGLDKLRAEIEATDYTIVVIDTFSRIAGGSPDQDNVGEMTDAMSGLQTLAQATGTAILVIDHIRKTVTDNPIDDLLGSTAKAAVPDCIIGLYKGQRGSPAELRIVGRDLGEDEIPVRFDLTTCCYQPAADEHGVVKGSVQSEVLEALEDLGGKSYAAEIAKTIDSDHANVCRELRELAKKGAVIRCPKEGRIVPYAIPEEQPQGKLSTNTPPQ